MRQSQRLNNRRKSHKALSGLIHCLGTLSIRDENGQINTKLSRASQRCILRFARRARKIAIRRAYHIVDQLFLLVMIRRLMTPFQIILRTFK